MAWVGFRQMRSSGGVGEEEEVADRRVMAAVWGPGGQGQPPTTLVMLDSQVPPPQPPPCAPFPLLQRVSMSPRLHHRIQSGSGCALVPAVAEGWAAAAPPPALHVPTSSRGAGVAGCAARD